MARKSVTLVNVGPGRNKSPIALKKPVELLSARNQAMQEAARIANKLEELDKRRVLFHILDEHDKEVDRISEALNLREFAVKAILEELEREFFS